ncbi:MAG: S-layer homology domain-containing protein, partial [Clostridia bacterium]|nr:S-layer homology domain-containing protein [Clostridia bacterium]
MKKLFTILAIAILALSLGINASAYSVDDGYLDRAVTLLTDLDIISQESDYTDPVTRGDFTNMLVKALGIGDVATSNPIPFTDVARGDSYYDAVETAYNLGIISRAE